MANLLDDYRQDAVTRQDYFDLFRSTRNPTTKSGRIARWFPG